VNYMMNVFHAAKGKVTTYAALALSGVAMLPDVLPQFWQDVAAFFPKHWPREQIHHALLAAGGLAIIWTRVRREIKE